MQTNAQIQKNTQTKKKENTQTQNMQTRIQNTREMQTKYRPNTDQIQTIQTKCRIHRRIFKTYLIKQPMTTQLSVKNTQVQEEYRNKTTRHRNNQR